MEHSASPLSVSWRWVKGVVYIILVALIWITASFVVQSVVDGGVSPFLITYICNSLFVVYIPIIEGGNWLKSLFQQKGWSKILNEKSREICEKGPLPPRPAERQNLLENRSEEGICGGPMEVEDGTPKNYVENENQSPEVAISEHEEETLLAAKKAIAVDEAELEPVGKEGEPWSRKRTALVGLWICPFWFLAQLTFNFSLRYTTVTSNTILSTTSSLFTLLVSIKFLGEKFTVWKLVSVLLCMSGSVLVTLSDSETEKPEIAPQRVWGDMLAIISAMFYAVYTALIRAKIPDEDAGKGECSTALVLGFLGLFNAVFFGPIALILHFTGIEPFHRLTLIQVGLIVGKGLLDNVLSDYLWAKAVLLTSPTVATAGLTIQVPIAAVIDSVRGMLPAPVNVMGGIMVLIGFFFINRSPVAEEYEKVSHIQHEGNTSTAASSGV